MTDRLTLACVLPPVTGIPHVRPPYRLRECRDGDFAQLGQLYLEAFGPEVAGATVAEAEADIRAAFAGDYGDFFAGASAVVEAPGGISAAVLTVREAPWHDTPWCPFIIDLFTARGHRRRGLARALMCHTMSAAKDAGFESMALRVKEDNAGALALYRALGFEPWAGQRDP